MNSIDSIKDLLFKNWIPVIVSNFGKEVAELSQEECFPTGKVFTGNSHSYKTGNSQSKTGKNWEFPVRTGKVENLPSHWEPKKS